MSENRYYLQLRVLTSAHVFEELVVDGFRLCPIDQRAHGGIVVRCEAYAENAVQAYRRVITRLVPVLDAISIVTQCAVQDAPLGSFCIYRKNDNPENVAFFHDARQSDAVGMVLHHGELADVRSLVERTSEDEQVAFGYLAEANRSPSPQFFLAMLLIAAEAFAGKSVTTVSCDACGAGKEIPTTDRKALEEVCVTELYDLVYRRGRLRHKLFHGGKVDDAEVAAAAAKLYERVLLEYLKGRHNLQSVRQIVAAPRNISYEYSRVFVRVDGVPDLLRLEEASRVNELNIAPAPASY